MLRSVIGSRKIQRGQQMKDVTIRDFSGGWNVVDNDLNLTTKFSKILRNMQRSIDGAIEVRPGTKLFCDLSADLDKIINIKYYNGGIVVVGGNGKIARVDAVGNYFVIWNADFAKTLPGAPTAWGDTTFASFAVFNGDLIVCNGVNKPLLIDVNFKVTYLNDLATGSNANTPICKYVLTHGRYLVMAGDVNAIDTIYISAIDTSGTWVGDPSPNDAVNVSLGSRVPSGDHTIKGLGRFRDKLVVAFDEALLPGTLGVYVSSNHVPSFDDAIENHGSVSHRVITTIGEDMYFCDSAGVNSVSRALFTGNVRSDRVSQLVDPEIQKDLGKLKTTSSLEDDTFGIYDSQNETFMLFIPNNSNKAQRTETRAFAFRKIEKLKVEAWYEYRNWNFQAVTRSALKRIFFAKDAQIYILGDQLNPVPRDFMGDQETFDDDTVFTDYTGFTPVASVADSGIPIPFIWELPWSDNGKRFNTKTSKYINFDTQGEDRFTVKMFIDNIYKDRDHPGESFLDDTLFDDGLGFDIEVLDPTLEMEFTAGDYLGFGLEKFGEHFGGGRTTADERLYAWPARYKIAKHRIEGDSYTGLKIVSMTLGYLDGSIRRP